MLSAERLLHTIYGGRDSVLARPIVIRNVMWHEFAVGTWNAVTAAAQHYKLCVNVDCQKYLRREEIFFGIFFSSAADKREDKRKHFAKAFALFVSFFLKFPVISIILARLCQTSQLLKRWELLTRFRMCNPLADVCTALRQSNCCFSLRPLHGIFNRAPRFWFTTEKAAALLLGMRVQRAHN